MKSLVGFAAMLGLCILSPIKAQQYKLLPSSVTASGGGGTLDEIIVLARTQPIPMENAPKGCAVKHVALYCRADLLPIKNFTVLEQRTSGSSSVSEPRIESGCIKIEMKLAVPLSNKPPAMCEGGEAKASLKLHVSTK